LIVKMAYKEHDGKINGEKKGVYLKLARKNAGMAAGMLAFHAFDDFINAKKDGYRGNDVLRAGDDYAKAITRESIDVVEGYRFKDDWFRILLAQLIIQAGNEFCDTNVLEKTRLMFIGLGWEESFSIASDPKHDDLNTTFTFPYNAGDNQTGYAKIVLVPSSEFPVGVMIRNIRTGKSFAIISFEENGKIEIKNPHSGRSYKRTVKELKKFYERTDYLQ